MSANAVPLPAFFHHRARGGIIRAANPTIFRVVIFPRQGIDGGGLESRGDGLVTTHSTSLADGVIL